MRNDTPRTGKPWYRERWGLVLLGFFAVAGFFVVTEHWAHVVPWLPWTLLLACPLMHVFMHRGHGGHGGHGGHSADHRAPRPKGGLPPAGSGGGNPPDGRTP
jgi:hypothetical protein